MRYLARFCIISQIFPESAVIFFTRIVNWLLTKRSGYDRIKSAMGKYEFIIATILLNHRRRELSVHSFQLIILKPRVEAIRTAGFTAGR